MQSRPKYQKKTYHIGEKVLVNHPKLVKGQKQGIAFKYHGPYSIIGINSNGCNYTIRKDKKGSKTKQVHKNNLKIFYERGQDLGAEPKLKDKSTSTDIDESVEFLNSFYYLDEGVSVKDLEIELGSSKLPRFVPV